MCKYLVNSIYHVVDELSNWHNMVKYRMHISDTLCIIFWFSSMTLLHSLCTLSGYPNISSISLTLRIRYTRADALFEGECTLQLEYQLIKKPLFIGFLYNGIKEFWQTIPFIPLLSCCIGIQLVHDQYYHVHDQYYHVLVKFWWIRLFLFYYTSLVLMNRKGLVFA